MHGEYGIEGNVLTLDASEGSRGGDASDDSLQSVNVAPAQRQGDATT
jgi:hypothetical protein